MPVQLSQLVVNAEALAITVAFYDLVTRLLLIKIIDGHHKSRP
jgi:hypothetical protein